MEGEGSESKSANSSRGQRRWFAIKHFLTTAMYCSIAAEYFSRITQSVGGGWGLRDIRPLVYTAVPEGDTRVDKTKQ